jgi:hypothetical protein
MKTTAKQEWESLRPLLAHRAWTDVEWLILEAMFYAGIRSVNAVVRSASPPMDAHDIVIEMAGEAQLRTHEIYEELR